VSTPIFTKSSETCALAAPLVQTKNAAKPASRMRCIVILPQYFPRVIASEAKQSSAEAPPGLLRRFAPRNDGLVGASLVASAGHGTRLSCMADCALWSGHAAFYP
jgi:hypothetical protein